MKIHLMGRIGAALLASGLFACSSPDQAAPPSPPAAATVRVGTASLHRLPATIEASASLEALRRVAAGSRILGRVDRLLAREGEAVKAGQLLARLDGRDLAAGATQAKASVAMAEAQSTTAAAMARRMRELRGRGSATDKNLEDALAGEQVAAASVDQARASLEAAEVGLSFAEVRSPISGWIVQRHLEQGDMATPGSPIFTIEDLSILEARAEIPESAVAGLSIGAPATIRVDSIGRSYETTLHRLVPAGDPRSRSFEARFQLPNPDGALKSGLFARVELARAGQVETLLVEKTALRQRGQLRYVFGMAGDRARLRYVRTGRSGADSVEILSGLAAGDAYLIDPPPSVVDGTPISASEGN